MDSETTLNVSSGDIFRFRGDNNNYGGSLSSPVINATFSFNVYGNIMSLISSTGFENLTTIPTSRCFYGFFGGSKVVDVSNLILPAITLTDYCYYYMFGSCTLLTTAPELPATTLATYCYSSMFNGCTSFTTAPELPATTLASRCYQTMFRYCTSLNYIKCLATDISAGNCTSSWVQNVAATGTFVKNPNMSGWGTGVNGIPSGWTVQTATE